MSGMVRGRGAGGPDLRWRSRRSWRWAGGGLAAALVVGLVVPWPLTVGGRFVAGPVMAAALVAPDEATVAQVMATEGEQVRAGAPVVRLQSFALQQQALTYVRLADSLDNRAEVARVLGRTAEADGLEDAETKQGAVLTGIEARLAALVLRTPINGVVATPRLDEKVGEAVDTGTVVARVVETDSVEVRVSVDPADASLVRPGQEVRLISYADPWRPVVATVRSVASAGARREARIHLPVSPPAWRVGVTGEAKIEVGRTSMLGAVIRAIR